MIPSRPSAASKANSELKEVSPRREETNTEWLARVGAEDGIVLFGGTSLTDFRIRVAQSHARNDMLPSFWSHVGVLRKGQIASVPLGIADPSDVPSTNAIQIEPVNAYRDPVRYANIAHIRFVTSIEPIWAAVSSIQRSRAIVDLPTLIIPWLAFIWGVGGQGNPLLSGQPLPSAAFVETLYTICEVALAPGMASSATCPEAIWQAAKWWRGYYESTQTAASEDSIGTAVPAGSFLLRQPAAAVVVEAGPVTTKPRARRR